MDKSKRKIGTPKGSAVAQTNRTVVGGGASTPTSKNAKPVQVCLAYHSQNGP